MSTGQPSRRSERPTDVALVRAMAAGDSGEPLAEFYSRFAGMVMALLVKMLGVRAEAEELLQDVFVELWRRADQYEPERAAVSTWIITIARSRALDAIRSRRRRRAEAHVTAEHASELQAPEGMQPDAIAAHNQRSQTLRNAVAALSAEQRQVLELAYFRGLSQSEIAAELDIPIGTVKSRAISAMKVLRAALAVGVSGGGEG